MAEIRSQIETAGIVVYFLCIQVLLVSAQEKILVFENIFSGKKVTLKSGDEVHLRFTVQDTVNAPFDVAVNDITIFGTVESLSSTTLYLATKNKYFDRTSISIPFTSIESFRKYSPLRPVAKTASVILASAAGLLATLQISESGDIVSWESAGLAVAASSAVLMSKELFSDRMKFHMAEGWRPQVKLVNY
ncbi:MAG: hypothetical protein ABIO46_03200 [Chitinophagales bacterium]